MDRTTLASIVQEHQVGIYRYLRYLGADMHLAQDLTQDVFLTILDRPETQENEQPSAGYLRGIARNLFLVHCRKNKNVLVADLEFALDRAEANWSNFFLRQGDGGDYAEALQKCLANLPPDKRRVLDLQYRQNQSRAQIAAACGLTEDGVKSLLRRVRQELANCVSRRLGLGPQAGTGMDRRTTDGP